jgi:hypothetical protein
MSQVVLGPRGARALQPDSSVPKFDDRMQALFGAISTFALLTVVTTMSLLEYLSRGHKQITLFHLAIFGLGACGIMLWLVLRGTSDRFAVLMMLATSRRIDSALNSERYAGCARLGPGRVRRALRNLWVPVTLQFALAGWLVYASGGISNSPYNMVPIVMLLIGQSVYVTPEVDLLDTRPRHILIYVRDFARAYCYPLAMFVLLTTAVVLLQEHHPLVTRPAPLYEHYATMLVDAFLSMLVVHATRRADQRSRRVD